MSEIVNVHAAKTHLSALLERVERGEEVVIARNGRPVARLVPEKPAERKPGRFKSVCEIPDSVFFDPLTEGDLALWEGRNADNPLGRNS